MSQVDPNARSGGCPFLVKSHDGDKPYYAIPALFSTQQQPQDEQKHDEQQQQQQKEQRPIVLFDKSCHRSQKLVQFLLKYDSQQNLRFAPIQSQVGELLLRRMSDEVRNEVLQQSPDDDDEQQEESSSSKGNGDGGNNKYYKSLVLCTPDTTYIQSSAMLKILASLSNTSSTGMKTAKGIKLLQYLGLASYIFPTKLRDKLYKLVVSKRRSTSAKNEYSHDYEQYQDRFVNDEVLTGSTTSSVATAAVNLFEGENPPQRGDTVRIIWPKQQPQQNSSSKNVNDPSITYDEEFPNGLCLVGGRGKITNVDLPLRVVLRVDRTSLGLETDVMGEETMIAWVKPSEVALV
jgi:predicted DCC family thiol-disulfide oxidoreductase YuxK